MLGSTEWHHGSIAIHPENLRGANSNELSSLVVVDPIKHNVTFRVEISLYDISDAWCVAPSCHVKRSSTRMVSPPEVAFHQFFSPSVGEPLRSGRGVSTTWSDLGCARLPHVDTQVVEVSIGLDWVMGLITCFFVTSPYTQVEVGREISWLDPSEA